jgi:hypothetical protein
MRERLGLVACWLTDGRQGPFVKINDIASELLLLLLSLLLLPAPVTAAAAQQHRATHAGAGSELNETAYSAAN